MLCANPFEQVNLWSLSQLCLSMNTYLHELTCCTALQAWNKYEVRLILDAKRSSLFVRVLTQELMSTLLMHYKTYVVAAAKYFC